MKMPTSLSIVVASGLFLLWHESAKKARALEEVPCLTAPVDDVTDGAREGPGRAFLAIDRREAFDVFLTQQIADRPQRQPRARRHEGLTEALDWLGSKGSELLASRQIVWEQAPYARGGYAFFDPGFDAQITPLPGHIAHDDSAQRWDNANLHDFSGTYGDYLLGKVGKVFPDLASKVT